MHVYVYVFAQLFMIKLSISPSLSLSPCGSLSSHAGTHEVYPGVPGLRVQGLLFVRGLDIRLREVSVAALSAF